MANGTFRLTASAKAPASLAEALRAKAEAGSHAVPQWDGHAIQHALCGFRFSRKNTTRQVPNIALCGFRLQPEERASAAGRRRVGRNRERAKGFERRTWRRCGDERSGGRDRTAQDCVRRQQSGEHAERPVAAPAQRAVSCRRGRWHGVMTAGLRLLCVRRYAVRGATVARHEGRERHGLEQDPGRHPQLQMPAEQCHRPTFSLTERPCAGNVPPARCALPPSPTATADKTACRPSPEPRECLTSACTEN